MVSSIMGYICYAMFVLVVVMLFNFVLARQRSKIAGTEAKELLDSTMHYFSNTPPEASVDREIRVQKDGKYIF